MKQLQASLGTKYLGTAEDLIAAKNQTPAPIQASIHEFGASAALFDLAMQLNS